LFVVNKKQSHFYTIISSLTSRKHSTFTIYHLFTETYQGSLIQIFVHKYTIFRSQ